MQVPLPPGSLPPPSPSPVQTEPCVGSSIRKPLAENREVG